MRELRCRFTASSSSAGAAARWHDLYRDFAKVCSGEYDPACAREHPLSVGSPRVQTPIPTIKSRHLLQHFDPTRGPTLSAFGCVLEDGGFRPVMSSFRSSSPQPNDQNTGLLPPKFLVRLFHSTVLPGSALHSAAAFVVHQLFHLFSFHFLPSVTSQNSCWLDLRVLDYIRRSKVAISRTRLPCRASGVRCGDRPGSFLFLQGGAPTHCHLLIPPPNFTMLPGDTNYCWSWRNRPTRKLFVPGINLLHGLRARALGRAVVVRIVARPLLLREILRFPNSIVTVHRRFQLAGSTEQFGGHSGWSRTRPFGSKGQLQHLKLVPFARYMPPLLLFLD